MADTNQKLCLFLFFVVVCSVLKEVSPSYSPSVSFYLDLYPKGEYWVQFPRKRESECVYEVDSDVLSCMGDYDYKTVTTIWKSSPADVLYVKVNCRIQDYFFINRYVCFCTNEKLSKSKYGESNFNLCQLRDLKTRTFHKLKNLKVLDLSGNYIKEIEPRTFAGLNNLTYLSLSGNPFSSLHEGILCDLPKIRFAHLSSTGLQVMPKLFSSCSSVHKQSLEYLFMSKGVLSKIPPNSLANLSGLIWLDLSTNRLTDLSNDAFNGGSALNVLDLSHNQLSYPLPDLCHSLPSLQVLRLQSCGFNAWDHNHFIGCSNLTDLDLSHNQISEVEGDFSATSLLKMLNFSRNRLKKIEPGFSLGNLSRIATLDISQNFLNEIYTQFLWGAENLMHLNLSENFLSEKSLNLTGLFENSLFLKSLDLSQNNVSVLPSKLFPNMTQLELLDVSMNKITEIHPDCFANTVGPEKLNLKENLLQTVQNGTFSRLTNLLVLDLSQNLISEVDVDSLPTSLREVHFNGNRLYDIPTAFRVRNFTSLEKLYLTGNRLTTLDRKCFLGFEALKVLDLSWNKISVIGRETFSELGTLEELYLQGNQLTIPAPGQFKIFYGAFNIRILNVAFNRIVDFQGFLTTVKHRLHKLKTLNMTGNPMQEISQPRFDRLDTDLRTLVLDHCELSFIDAQAFYELRMLDRVFLRNNKLKHFPPFYINRSVEFDLSENPAECSCHMKWLKKTFWKEYGIQIMVILYYIDTCFSRLHDKYLPIKEVPERDFLCETELSCPDNCKCFNSEEGAQPEVIQAVSVLKYLPQIKTSNPTRILFSGSNFSENGALQKIMPLMWYHTEELHFNSCEITALADDFFANQPLLKIIHLENNRIDALSEDIFSNLALLEELYLSYNRLERVFAGTFRQLKKLTYLDLRGNKLNSIDAAITETWAKIVPLQFIYLSDNPWHCSCSTVSFRNWLASNILIVRDWRSVTCSGKSIVELKQVSFQCKRVTPRVYIDHKSKGFLIGLLLLAVFLVVTATFLYRIRKTIKALLFTKFGFAFQRAGWEVDKHFDAFVLYNIYNQDGEAERWVTQELVPTLENRDKPYKLFLPDRDISPDESVVDTTSQSIPESRRTIVVISKSFSTSQWCSRTFQMAYRHMLQNKKHKILIVFYDKVKVSELDPVMKVFVIRGDYLNCWSRCFWERLYYEMPDPRDSHDPVSENEAGLSETDIILQNAIAGDFGTSSHV